MTLWDEIKVLALQQSYLTLDTSHGGGNIVSPPELCLAPALNKSQSLAVKQVNPMRGHFYYSPIAKERTVLSSIRGRYCPLKAQLEPIIHLAVHQELVLGPVVVPGALDQVLVVPAEVPGHAGVAVPGDHGERLETFPLPTPDILVTLTNTLVNNSLVHIITRHLHK